MKCLANRTSSMRLFGTRVEKAEVQGLIRQVLQSQRSTRTYWSMLQIGANVTGELFLVHTRCQRFRGSKRTKMGGSTQGGGWEDSLQSGKSKPVFRCRHTFLGTP